MDKRVQEFSDRGSLTVVSVTVPTSTPWWKKSVFYQIYPRSYSDSTNNGIGDLRGIINKIRGGYLTKLGIDAIWLSPMYPSPQEDFGYDITDFNAINPEYGTMDDFDELLEVLHANNIKIILDMVLNHTSHKHKWFKQSKTSLTNPKREWYVWKKGKGKHGKSPPNNWKAIIGGSAWEWDETTEEFYLHQFLPCQPDLNWQNSEVKKAMFNSMKFWLDKGVDGFRLDIIHTVFEDTQFRDNPRSIYLLPSHLRLDSLFQNPIFTQFLPETVDLCVDLRSLVDNYNPERVLIGEAAGGPEIISPLYGTPEKSGLNLVFDFQFANQSFSSKKFKNSILDSITHLNDFWPCYTFSNHDTVRMISRYGNSEKKARVLTLLLLTVRGTPVIYQGEEIGMHQGKIPRNKVVDPIGKWKIWGLPLGRFFGRDGCRTPFQWTNSKINAGFSSNPDVKPWLPISSNFQKINVESQEKNEYSMFNFYRELLRFRHENEWLQEGKMEFIETQSKHCLAFSRNLGPNSGMVILNFHKKPIRIINPFLNSEKVFSTDTLSHSKVLEKYITVNRYEGIIIQKKSFRD